MIRPLQNIHVVLYSLLVGGTQKVAIPVDALMSRVIIEKTGFLKIQKQR